MVHRFKIDINLVDTHWLSNTLSFIFLFRKKHFTIWSQYGNVRLVHTAVSYSNYTDWNIYGPIYPCDLSSKFSMLAIRNQLPLQTSPNMPCPTLSMNSRELRGISYLSRRVLDKSSVTGVGLGHGLLNFTHRPSD